MEEIYESLLALQKLDGEIAEAEERVRAFDPELAVIDAPAEALARELAAAREQLTDLQERVRKLERDAADKQALLDRFEERHQRVRTSREVEAVLTEIDLVRSALDADETETLELMDQALRTELRADDLERKLGEARAAIEPRREELEAAKSVVDDELSILRDRRHNHAIRLNPASVQLYDRIRVGRNGIAIVGVTPDGACGGCYGFIPIQRRSEIEEGKRLMSCEECGVILHPTRTRAAT